MPHNLRPGAGRLGSVLGIAHRLILTVALPIGAVNMSTGCGAIFNQESAVVPVRVNPAGARVYVDGQLVGQAPLNVSLPSTTAHTVDVDAPGYEKQSLYVGTRVDASYVVLDCVLLLFIIPGIVALIVDGSSGDWHTLDRNDISVTLLPVKAPTGEAGGPGCQFDTQCKDDRICVWGHCVPPPAARQPPPTPPNAPSP